MTQTSTTAAHPTPHTARQRFLGLLRDDILQVDAARDKAKGCSPKPMTSATSSTPWTRR